METIIAQLINGLAVGSTYALVLLGMTLLYLVRGIVHFGFAYIVILAAYLGWMVLGVTGGNLLIAIPAFILFGFVFTLISEPLFRPLAQKHAFMETLIVGQGIAIILTDVFSHFINAGRNVAFPHALTTGGAVIRFGSIFFTLSNVYTLVGGVASVVILFYFLYRTKQGRAIRAMAQDLDIARSLGIPFNKTGLIGFGVAGLLAGISALLIVMTLGIVSPSLGDTFSTKALVLMLFAGMGNLKGAMICAVGMGVVEVLAQSFLPGQWTQAIVFSVIMLVILIKPNGVFGQQT